jgi:hypothetical protein
VGGVHGGSVHSDKPQGAPIATVATHYIIPLPSHFRMRHARYAGRSGRLSVGRCGFGDVSVKPSTCSSLAGPLLP